MRGKCSAKLTSTISKYGVEMYVQRDVPAATIRATYDINGNRFLIIVEKDASGYNDKTSFTMTLSQEDARELAKEILNIQEE